MSVSDELYEQQLRNEATHRKLTVEQLLVQWQREAQFKKRRQVITWIRDLQAEFEAKYDHMSDSSNLVRDGRLQ